MSIKSFKDLIVWQRAIQLADAVYDLFPKFPVEERFGLVDQLRRSITSVPSNISEGSQRGGKKEFIQFLWIARGSLAEVETQLILAKNRKYITESEFQKIESLIEEVSRMSMRLIQSLKGKS